MKRKSKSQPYFYQERKGYGIWFVLLIVLLMGCQTSTPFRTSPRPTSIEVTATSPDIGTRVGADGFGEFFNRISNETFLPRGNVWTHFNADGKGHFTFHVDHYNPAEVEQNFILMKSHGYNVVRSYIDAHGIAEGLHSPGLNSQYVENLMDYLKRARKYGIYIIFVHGRYFPQNYSSYLKEQLALYPDTVDSEGLNKVLISKAYRHTYRKYLQDLVLAISSYGVESYRNLFAIIHAEIYNFTDKKPWNIHTGLETICGQITDMANAVQRQAAIDQCAKIWAQGISNTIKQVFPGLLNSTSLVSPQTLGQPGYNGVYSSGQAIGFFAEHRVTIRLTAVEPYFDFVDPHIYFKPPPYSTSIDLESMEWSHIPKAKPRMATEYYVLNQLFPNPYDAGIAAKTFLQETCDEGLRGWLLWIWEPPPENLFWTPTESQSLINEFVSPKNLPNPCD